MSSPGWTRTTDRLLVRKLPLPLGHRTRMNDEARMTNDDLVLSSFRHSDFVISSCGGWNRTNIRAFRAPRPTVERPRRSCFASSGGRNRTYGLLVQSQASLPTATTPEYSRVPCGSRTRLASLVGWNLCRSAKDTSAEGVRVELTRRARRSTAFEAAAIARWLALPFSCGGRNRTCVTTINSRLPVPAQDPPQWEGSGGRGRESGKRKRMVTLLRWLP